MVWSEESKSATLRKLRGKPVLVSTNEGKTIQGVIGNIRHGNVKISLREFDNRNNDNDDYTNAYTRDQIIFPLNELTGAKLYKGVSSKHIRTRGVSNQPPRTPDRRIRKGLGLIQEGGRSRKKRRNSRKRRTHRRKRN